MAGASLNSYKVEVQTGDVRGAGTDSDVTVTVFGSKGDTGARSLESSANNFERGQVDTFFFMVRGLGGVREHGRGNVVAITRIRGYWGMSLVQERRVV